VPVTQPHDPKKDAIYGYAKALLVGSQDVKVFMATCNKLPFNLNNEKREQECRLASGYFLVRKAGLFKMPKSKFAEDLGVEVV
jgi:hypothetical protein